MNDPVENILQKIVETSPNKEEMIKRVKRSMGDDQLSRAHSIAYSMKGAAWLSDTDEKIGSRPEENVMQVSHAKIPTSIHIFAEAGVLALGSIIILLLLLFPPHITPTPEGWIINNGFSSLNFSSGNGQLAIIVNTPLLATMIGGVSLATIGVALAIRVAFRK